MSRQVTIQNTEPRRDIHGRVIDCHDGCLRFFGGRFYLYGTSYGGTDGFTTANAYVCYSSTNLVAWVPHGPVLQSPPKGVYYRPYVVWNPATKLYVLWYNWYPKLWEGQVASAVSRFPEGPFRVVNPRIELCGTTPGDHNLFVDDDGTGYVVYTDIAGRNHDRHAMAVERLNADFITSTLQGSSVLDRRVEAPVMFKREGRYYVIFGNTCCFCPEGADARVFVAESPLGPYRQIGDINRDHADRIIIPGQQTDIASIPTAHGTVHLWMADLWGSRPDGIKGHDLQYWIPLEFNDDGSIRKLRWMNAFQLHLRHSRARPRTLPRDAPALL
jgi:hypothetical protein